MQNAGEKGKQEGREKGHLRAPPPQSSLVATLYSGGISVSERFTSVPQVSQSMVEPGLRPWLGELYS